MSTTLKLFVDDIAATLQSYSHMKVRRAPAEAGPYTELTAATAQPAEIVGTATGPFTVSGTTLQLQINRGVPENIVFSGIDPLSIGAVCAQINAVYPGLAQEVGGVIVLRTTDSGTAARIDILTGSAAAILGFIEGDHDAGEEPWVTLVSGQNSYDFYDRDGGDSEYYQAAFYNQANGLTSQWSTAFKGEPGTVIDTGNLSIGRIDLVDGSGSSLPGQSIVFYPMWEPQTIDGFQVAMSRTPITITTNNSGHAEVSLVRGLKVKAVFEETSFIREFTVPDAPTFDILAVMGAAPDPFNPVAPDFPDAPRRTL